MHLTAALAQALTVIGELRGVFMHCAALRSAPLHTALAFCAPAGIGTALTQLQLALFALWPFGRTLRYRQLPTTVRHAAAQPGGLRGGSSCTPDAGLRLPPHCAPCRFGPSSPHTIAAG